MSSPYLEGGRGIQYCLENSNDLKNCSAIIQVGLASLDNEVRKAYEQQVNIQMCRSHADKLKLDRDAYHCMEEPDPDFAHHQRRFLVG